MLDSGKTDWNYKKVESYPYTNDTTATASVNTEKLGWNDSKTVRINGEETKSNSLNEIAGLADRVKSITDRLDAEKQIETNPKKKEAINDLIEKITLRFVYIENMRKSGLDDLPFDTNAEGKIDEAFSKISFIVLNEQKATLENLLAEATALLDNKEDAKVEMKVEEPASIPFDSVTPTTPETITPNKVEGSDMADLRSQINALNARVDTLQQQVDYLSNANSPYRSLLDMDDQVRANFNQPIQPTQTDIQTNVPLGVVPGDETVRSKPLDETVASSPVIDTPSLDDTVPTSYNPEEEIKDNIMEDFEYQTSQLQRVPFTTMLARSESLRNKYQQLLDERDFMRVKEFKEAIYKLLGEIKLVDRMAPPVPNAQRVIPKVQPFDTDMPVPISITPLS